MEGGWQRERERARSDVDDRRHRHRSLREVPQSPAVSPRSPAPQHGSLLHCPHARLLSAVQPTTSSFHTPVYTFDSWTGCEFNSCKCIGPCLRIEAMFFLFNEINLDGVESVSSCSIPPVYIGLDSLGFFVHFFQMVARPSVIVFKVSLSR